MYCFAHLKIFNPLLYSWAFIFLLVRKLPVRLQDYENFLWWHPVCSFTTSTLQYNIYKVQGMVWCSVFNSESSSRENCCKWCANKINRICKEYKGAAQLEIIRTKLPKFTKFCTMIKCISVFRIRRESVWYIIFQPIWVE